MLKRGDYAYFVKYALTNGLIPLVQVHEVRDHGKMRYLYIQERPYSAWLEDRDLFVSFEDALARAEQMRSTKLTTLTNQIERLHNVTFRKDPAYETNREDPDGHDDTPVEGVRTTEGSPD